MNGWIQEYPKHQNIDRDPNTIGVVVVYVSDEVRFIGWSVYSLSV